MVNRGMVHDGSWWFMALGLPPSDFMTGWLHDCLRALLASGLDVGAWVVPKWLCWKKHGKMNVFFSNLGKTRQMLFLETWSTVGLKSNFCERVWLKITKKRDGMAPNMACASNLKKPSSLTNTGLIFFGFCVIFANKFSQKGFHPRGQLQNLKMESSENGLPLKSIVCHNLN